MTTLADVLRQDFRERVVLVELDYVAEVAGAPETQTLYFSSSLKATHARADLTAGDGTSPLGPPVIYEDCLNSVPDFQRSISGPIGSTYSSSLGSIEIDNADGDKDPILALALDGSQVRAYVWDAGIKYHVWSAIALKTTAPSIDRISIAVKDAGVLLNQSVGGEEVIGGAGPNADQWRPVNFGYVHNLEAKVYDAPGLIYVHSDTGTNTLAAEVRDRGVSVTFTDNADGTFTLDASPAGVITCDVFASYDGTDATRRVSDFLQFLVGDRLANNQGQGFAGPHLTYTIGDDDDYLIGISIPEARNIEDVLNQACDSGNCFWAIKRTGEFTYGRLRPNNIADFGYTVASLTDDDWDQGSFRVDHDAPLYYLLQAYMSRNWYRQTDFAGALTPDEQAVFTRPGIFLLQATAVGSAYADIPEAYHKTLSVSPAIDTLLSGGFDELDLPYLEAWMETRRFVQLPWIERVSLTVGMEWYELELGDPVELVTPRFGMDAGELFQVTSINIRLTQSKIDLVLLRRHPAEPLPPGWSRITVATDYVPPPAALRPVVNPPPPNGGGGISPEVCGWLLDPVTGSRYFVPCGGGGGPTPAFYTFRIGGIATFDDTYLSNAPHDLSIFLGADFVHSPVWYTISGNTVLVDSDQIDLDTSGAGSDIYIPLTTLLASANPANIGDQGCFENPSMVWDIGSGVTDVRLDDLSLVSANNTAIAYSGNAIVQELHTFIPGGGGGTITLGPWHLQLATNYDYGAPDGRLVIAVALIGVEGNPFVQAIDGHLVVTIQNNTGSTVTAFNIPHIYLPTDAVDPDALTGDEIDVSFAGGVQAVLQRQSSNGGGATIGGDRHDLQLSVTGASIVDGQLARYLFAVQCPTAVGTYTGYPGALAYQPAFAGTITTTPSLPVRIFTDTLLGQQVPLVQPSHGDV